MCGKAALGGTAAGSVLNFVFQFGFGFWFHFRGGNIAEGDTTHCFSCVSAV